MTSQNGNSRPSPKSSSGSSVATSSQHSKSLAVDGDQSLGVEPFWWFYSQVFRNFHQSNTTYKPRLTSIKDVDEQKKYELVLVETAAIVFRFREEPSELLAVLDEVFTKDAFPKVPLDLSECICKAVSHACDIDLHEIQMVSHISELLRNQPRGKCSHCKTCECFSESEDDTTKCMTWNDQSEDHRLLLADGRIQAELGAEWECLERLLKAAQETNWKGYELYKGNLRLSAGWTVPTPPKKKLL
ncbi:hypothetical protein EJ08DRAFT_657691 [Tothia fuscella]|uniref:Uncharacterized protein n=1 Tax=Tothia fuscella TaxID=1048955 RepID=A0A9P4NZL5_9PEZI|nr:hypothetical protein EJ08DRAFT_657691 [Tothia fuscella]